MNQEEEPKSKSDKKIEAQEAFKILQKRKEDKSTINDIYNKGYLTDDDKNKLWDIYNRNMGQFPGNLNCGDCIRDAIRNLRMFFGND